MNSDRPWGSMVADAHKDACRKVGAEGMVLLQNNENLLPIDLSKVRRITVIGENAIKMMTVGGGSSSLKAKYEVTPLEGLRKRIGKQAEIIYARGYVGDPTGGKNWAKLEG